MKIIKEVVFWIVVLVFLVIVFGSRISDYSGAFLFTAFLLPVLIGSSYTISEYLIPQFLLRRKYSKFVLYTIYTIIISLNLTILVMVLSFSVIANYRFDEMLPASRDVFGLALVILFIALLKSSWQLVKKLFVQEDELKQLVAKDKSLTAGYLNVKANRQEQRLAFEEITHLESLADYLKVHRLKGEAVITRERISAINERLPGNFLRVHRSFIVNLKHAGSFSAEAIYLDKIEIPIGRKYKAAVMAVLKEQET